MLVDHVNAYFRFLAVDKNKAISSINQYSYTFRQFSEWLSIKSNYLWESMTEVRFKEWRDEERERLANVSKLKKDEDKKQVENTVDKKIDTLYQFYWWAQNKGYFNDLLGEGLDEYKLSYRIPIEKVIIDDKCIGIKSPIRFNSNYRKQTIIPTDDEVDDLYEALTLLREKGNHKFKEELITRDHLMVEWMSTVGPRVQETTYLCVKDLPDIEIIEDDEDNERMSQVLLNKGTKGGKARIVMVYPDLIRRTLDFIEVGRNTLLAGKTSINEIFITTRKKGIASKTLSNLYNTLAKLFPSVLKKLIHPHLLRHVALTNLAEMEMESLNDANDSSALKGIALIVSQQAGHSDKDFTNKTYIHTADKRLQNKKKHNNKHNIEVLNTAHQKRKVKLLEAENKRLKEKLQ